MVRRVLVSIVLLMCVDARADDLPVDVADVLDGKALARHVTWLEDRDGTLTIADVERRPGAFRRAGQSGPTIAFSRSTFWARLPVRNGEADARRWFLEVAYPHLDELTLYTPRAGGDGYDAQVTGDTCPFAQRDVWFYNFVFERTEPGRSERAYYLRVRSRGKVSLPLHAWEPSAFYQHQLREWGVFSALYGALAVMIAYVVCIYFVLGGVEHLWYAAFLAAALFGDFTLSGHTFQLLLPNHPELVHRLLPLLVEAGYTAVAWMIGAQMSALGLPPSDRLRYGALALLVLIPALPYELAVRGLMLHAAVLVPCAGFAVWAFAKRGARAANQFVISFSLPLLGVLITSVGLSVERDHAALTRWAFMVGVLAQAVLVSSSIADQLNITRARLAVGNALHTERIEALSSALGRATRAAREAERATRTRDRFLVTLSHEFRTPLNAIINIPAALREDFSEVRTASCTRCGAGFELEHEEVFDPAIQCPECKAPGALEPESGLAFTGDGRHAKHLLGRVLRSGRRLLRVVNDILTFSRMQAKSVELVRDDVNLAVVVRKSIAQALRDTQLTRDMVRMEVPEDLMVWADEERLADIFLQLLDNAVKFARGACRVTIRAAQHGSGWLISVEDEGIGIDAADRERIFAEFEQVSSGDNRRYGGTGIGLTLCRAFVEAHGGKIWVESTPKVGSTFYLTLPGPSAKGRPDLVAA